MNQISTEETRAKQLELANEAACALSTALMTFLSLSLYVGIITASTTDEMLVKATTVTLPFFNVSISIVGFHALAPWLVVLHHGTALTSPASVREYLQLKLRDRKAENFGAVFLDNRHRVLCFEEMFQGTVDSGSALTSRSALQYVLTTFTL